MENESIHRFWLVLSLISITLTFISICLKHFQVFDANWVWVLLPLWGPAALVLSVFILIGILFGIMVTSAMLADKIGAKNG